MIEGLRKALCADRVLHTIAYVGVFCLIVVGCIPENVDIPGYDSDSSIVAPDTTVVTDSVPVLEVSVPDGSVNYFSEGISFGHTADELSIAFRVAEEWTVKVIDVDNNPVDWCRVSPSLGGAGLHEMKVSIKENTSKDFRTAHIIFMAFEDVSKTAMIEVRQEGVNLFLERTDYEVASGDTTIVVELKANVDIEYKIVGADWVRELPAASRALTSHNVAFAIDANPSHKSREAHILFYNSQYPVAADTLTLVQQGLTPTATVPEGYTDYFTEGLIFNFVKGEAEVAFHSNVDWTLQLVAASGESVSWCSVEQSSGKAGLQKVKVRVADNDTYAHRSVILRLMCDTTVMGEILVLQERENAILLGRKDYTVSCEGATIDVSLSTNVDFEYKILDAEWVREQQSTTRGLTTHNLTFVVDANPSHKPRASRIVFYSSQYAIADTLTLAQEGVVPTASIPEGYTDYFTNALSFGPMESEAEVTFQVNVDWQLATVGASSWLSVEPSSGTAGQQTVTIRVTENNAKVERTATISLMCDDIKLAEMIVTQEEKMMELSQTNYTVSYEATTINVTLNTNVNFEYEINDVDWVREQQSVARGSVTHNFVFEVDANPSRESREAKIVFHTTNDDIIKTLIIVQEGVGPKASILEGSYFVFDYTAGEKELTLDVNTDWYIKVPYYEDYFWMDVDCWSGDSGLYKLKVSVEEHKGYTGRYRCDSIYIMCDAGLLLGVGIKQECPEVHFPLVVDLGLSVKWASHNIGAEYPADYGGYYAWGETEEKNDYSWDTYKWCAGSNTSLAKYCTDSDFGIVDNITTLVPEDDVAHVKWGNCWRMPTYDEIKELHEKCHINEIFWFGAEFIGPNGNTVFFPWAGHREGSSEGGGGVFAECWSNTVNDYNDGAWIFCSGLSAAGNERCYGFPVRPVWDERLTVTTTDAKIVSRNVASIGGIVRGLLDACGVIYGTSANLSSTNGIMKSTISNGSYSIKISDLVPNTTYYYRAYAVFNGEYKYGDVKSFTTKEESNNTVSNKTYTVEGVSFKMIFVEGGSFIMGSNDSDANSDESPIHQVTLSNYTIGETEVTQELWQAVMDDNPSTFIGDLQHPVESVSWNDCQTFITKLNELTGEDFRLPREAEWEYAARGGSIGKGHKFSGSSVIDDVAWYDSNSGRATHPVKTKQPNELGIYGMSGNVWEWCADWYGSYSSSSQINPTGSSLGSKRVLRGGGWDGSKKSCRITHRHPYTPNFSDYSGGFRLVKE